MSEYINHDLVPRPTGKAVPMAKIDTFQEALDYALAAFHVCCDKVDKGEEKDRWNTAGWGYQAAYMTIVSLKDLPGDQLAKCKGALAEADHKADVAAGRAKQA